MGNIAAPDGISPPPLDLDGERTKGIHKAAKEYVNQRDAETASGVVTCINLFLSYAHEDIDLLKLFDKQLGALKNENIIKVWWDGQILPGADWSAEIAQRLEAADLIVLLISSSFLNSTKCYKTEMRRAIERHQAGAAYVIWVLLRDCYWSPTPFAKLQGLPPDMKAIDLWPKRKWNTVLADVAKAIHHAALSCAAGHPPAPPPDQAADLFYLPLPRNRFFTGRCTELDTIYQSLHTQDTGGTTRVAAITGLGGTGKTQIALEYAYRHRAEYSVVWWVEAETSAGLDRSFTELALALHLPNADPADLRPTLVAVQRWLKRTSGWLLILDNVTTPEMLRPYLPATLAGHLLITSRDPFFRTLGDALPIPCWPRPHSIEFLLKRSEQTDAPGADDLAEELGDLPLALEQAAAYIEQTDKPFGEYLAHYRDRKHFNELARAGQPPDYTGTVLTTWDVSLAAAEGESSVAGDLLRLLAFLAPNDIPRALLLEKAHVLPPSLAGAIRDGIAFDQAVGALHRYSLIETTCEAFAVHRLVQAVTRNRITDTTDRVFWASAAITLIDAAFPTECSEVASVQYEVASWPLCSRLSPHAEAALQVVMDPNFPTDVGGQLLDRLSRYLHAVGRFDAAESLLNLAIARKDATQGHVLAQYLMDLANLLHAKAHYVDAKLRCKNALRIRKKLLGLKHPDVAESLHTMGRIERNMGRREPNMPHYAKAAILFKLALEIREQTLGPRHLTVTDTLNSMAALYRFQGRLDEALSHVEQALTIRIAVFGLEHLQTAHCLNHKAIILYGLGRDNEAEPIFRQVLHIRERLLPEDNYEIATTLHELAELCRAQKRFDEAQQLYEHALNIREKVLGPTHDSTVKTKAALTACARREIPDRKLLPFIPVNINLGTNTAPRPHVGAIT